MAGLGDVTKLLGNDTIKAILVWQVAGQLFEPILAPVVQALTDEINVLHQQTPLSPADVVEAVVKSIETPLDLDHEFRRSGLDPDRYKLLVDTAGEPPGLETLLEWARRGIIEWGGAGAESTGLEQGIRESRIKNKWIAPIKAARTRPLDPSEAVAAAVRGNLPPDQAQQLAFFSGVSPEDFGTMVHNAGRPPSPGELLELYKRGLIPAEGTGPEVLSVQQGIYEGDTKDKWWKAYLELARYIPPPRTVTALLREGSISPETAKQLLEDAGLEGALADAYIQAASKGHQQAAKELSKAEVLQLYREGIIGQAAAKADLQKLGLTEQDAAELLQLQDQGRDRAQLQQVVSRIRTLYLGHHITEQDATEALRESGSDQATITHLLTLWGLERRAPQERITAAQIASAAYYKAMTPVEAYGALQGIGYTDFDAWIILADRLHGPPEGIPRPPLPAWSG